MFRVCPSVTLFPHTQPQQHSIVTPGVHRHTTLYVASELWLSLPTASLSISQLKLSRDLREKAGQQYENISSTLKDLQDHVKEMLSRTAQGEENKVTWLPDETEEDSQIEWLKPKPTRFQSTLDYSKQLSERVYSGLKSISGATSYLPHHLKGGATQAYDYAQELYTQLKPVR